MKPTKRHGKPAAKRPRKDLPPKKTSGVKGGSPAVQQKPDRSTYEGGRVVTYSIVNAWPTK
jgi:hypothetical protein